MAKRFDSDAWTLYYFKVAPVLLLLCAVALANCPAGSTSVPNGNLWCGWDNNNVFQCWPQVDCIDNCDLDPTECDEELARTPNLKVTRHWNGKLKTLHRLVVHTEAKLDGSKFHVWILKDPDTKKITAVVTPRPVGASAPSAKVQSLVVGFEAAFARQFSK